ncbi:MAG: MBL fold metallo-hydrolase [Thermodesulfobacteriota bacterium]
MIFKQFHLESLGHASYFIGSERTGEALVLDVRRDVDVYFAEARAQGMRIRYAVDTHQHNDYLTGICELPVRGDIQLLASARAELRYPVRRLADGERFEMGEVVCEVLHTPGHTPEHISLLVTDRSRGEAPALLLAGGALLVGDVARPDLLGGRAQAEQHARELCRTLREKILTLPDFVEVYPTHVAGSLCGGHIGSRLSTTIGYERRMNTLLASLDAQEEFVGQCVNLQQLPAVPPYWTRMRRLNQHGPPLLGVLAEPPALIVPEFDRRRGEGAVVLDCRSPEAFAAHIPGALNVGAGAMFATWAGTVLPPETPYLLVLDHAVDLWDLCWQLLRIGYALPQGWLAGGMWAWRTAAKEIAFLPQWTVGELHRQRERDRTLFILDVRQPQEWMAGHIPHATHITGAALPARSDEVPRDRPVAVICGSGYRSSVCASLLQSRGHRQVVNILGGMDAWRRAGLLVAQETEQ